MSIPYFFSGQVLTKDKTKSRFSDLKLNQSYLFRGPRNRKILLIRDNNSVLEAILNRSGNLVMASRYSSPTRNEEGDIGYNNLTLITDNKICRQYRFYLRFSNRVKKLAKRAE